VGWGLYVPSLRSSVKAKAIRSQPGDTIPLGRTGGAASSIRGEDDAEQPMFVVEPVEAVIVTGQERRRPLLTTRFTRALRGRLAPALGLCETTRPRARAELA
jgi:hypothetical protein